MLCYDIWVILWLDIFFGFMHIIYMYALLFIHPRVLELSFVRKTMCHYYCILSLPGASPRSKHVKSVDWCLQLCNSGFEKFIQDRFMFAKYITLVLKDRDICLTTSTDWLMTLCQPLRFSHNHLHDVMFAFNSSSIPIPLFKTCQLKTC